MFVLKEKFVFSAQVSCLAVIHFWQLGWKR